MKLNPYIEDVYKEKQNYNNMLENGLNWMQLAHLLSILSLHLRALFLCIYLYFNILNELLKYTHKRKTIPLPYAYCVR